MNNFVSIIIVNYNGKKWLNDCLTSVFNQNYKNIEVILVDNHSSDDSVNYVKNNFLKVMVVRNKKNNGFAKGNNIGLKYAKGDYILLLNTDTILKKNTISNLLKAFNEIPNLGCVQPKMILFDKKHLDACGSFWTNTTMLYHYGYGKNKNLRMYNKPFPVFSVKGACMLIKREVINKIGLFDNDFWCYYEETDFCHRAWISGYECWYYPKAEMYHAGGGTSVVFNNSLIQFHNFKNKLMSMIKNFELKALIRILIVHLLVELMVFSYYLLRLKFSLSLSIIRGFYWNIRNIRKTIHKRKLVQKNRKVSYNEIFKKVKKNPRLSYYWYLFNNLREYKD